MVNLDPQHKHSGWLELPVEQFRLDPAGTYQMHDLLTGARVTFGTGRAKLRRTGSANIARPTFSACVGTSAPNEDFDYSI